ncbi:MAG TPA: lytic transglycosylase domain-containing protein [Vicinamibacterales bacterium]|nr:lytic transglycosylase domain-containing protein [Vicinamibacterales bacterium]
MKRMSLIPPAVALLALLAAAAPASAEIAFLSSGRTLSIKAHRIDGDNVVLTLRSGGEVTCDKDLITKIEPDEVPYVDPDAPKVAVPVTNPPSGDEDETSLDATPYGEIIAAASETYGVNPMLVRALIQVESKFRPTARSRKGAMGLMQLMPSTAREYNVRNPFEPKANIEAGIKHLKTLIDRFGSSIELGLAAYNAGPGAVEKFNGVPPYRETRNYVSRILSLAGLK